MVSCDRRWTRPLIPTTNSERSFFALFISGSSSLSKTICVIPSRSRTSMNNSPPKSRTRWTHPSSTTSAPTSSGRSAPQVCVRVSSPSCSATSFQFLEDRGACRRLFVRLLGLAGEVLDRHGAGGDFVAPQDGDVGNLSRVSVLDLFADFVRVRVDEHPQSRLTES